MPWLSRTRLDYTRLQGLSWGKTILPLINQSFLPKQPHTDSQPWANRVSRVEQTAVASTEVEANVRTLQQGEEQHLKLQ